MSFYRALLRVSALASVIVLGACGGGGGGGGGGGPAGPAFSLTESSLSFNAPLGATPGSQTLHATVTGVSSGALFFKILVTGQGIASVTNVTITGPTTGTADVNPVNASLLGPGTFHATITVKACTTDPDCLGVQLPGSPKTVNATYTVPGLTASPGTLNYAIGNAPVAGDLSRQFSVAGFPDQSFTVTADQPWLSFQPASGTLGGSPQVTALLDQAQINGMTNGDFLSTITVTPASGTPVTVIAHLSINRTQVNYIAPHVGTTSISARAIIRGNNFNGVTITGVNIASTVLACPGASCTPVSDTEIDVTYPALPLGTYSVQLVNAENITTSFAQLVIVDPPAYPAKALAYPGTAGAKNIRSLAYDAERQALAVGVQDAFDSTVAGLAHFAFSGGDWQAPTLRAKTIDTGIVISDAAMTADGKQYLLMSDASITPVDAATFTVGSGFGCGNSVVASCTNLGVTNDGFGLVTLGSTAQVINQFPIQSAGFTPGLPFLNALPLDQPLISKLRADNARVGVSADGSLAIFLETNGIGGGSVITYLSGTSAVDATALTRNAAASSTAVDPNPVVDRNGQRVGIISATNGSTVDSVAVYNQFLGTIGTLPTTTLAMVFRPDPLGAPTRVYTLDSACTVRAFSLPPSSPGDPLPELISSDYPIAIMCPGDHARMAISPDGGTVFVAGGLGLFVVPAP